MSTSLPTSTALRSSSTAGRWRSRTRRPSWRPSDVWALDSLSAPDGDSTGPVLTCPRGLRGGTPMEEWIEEDLDLLSRTEEPAPRVLDQRMIREPIRLLAPRRPVTLPPSATVGDAIDTMREHRIGCVLVADNDRLL